MAKKKTKLSSLIFDEVNPFGYGGDDAAAAGFFSLELVLPDISQPRRLIPDDLIEAIYEGEMMPLPALETWLQRAADPHASPARRRDVRELRRLANSIAQHGLINPITIRPAPLAEVPAPFEYVIVTGERRYWSHLLLLLSNRQIVEGEHIYDPDQLKASLAPDGVSIRAHQLIENFMREDISVVEKAQGLWALRQELSDDAYRRHELADGKLVPWKSIEQALDISRQYRGRIVNVLTHLPSEAQELVHHYNLAEATIRPIVEKLRSFPELQLQAIRQLVAWQEAEARGEGNGRRIVPSVRTLVDSLLRGDGVVREQRMPASALNPIKFSQLVRRLGNQLEKLDEEERQVLALQLTSLENSEQVWHDLLYLRDALDVLLQQMNDG